MKRAIPLLFLLSACIPDIAHNAPPGASVVAEFDLSAMPAVAPTPNDLAISTGKIVVPPTATDTPAQTEYNQTYLGTLSAFPQESPAQVRLSGPLQASTVNPRNVVVFDTTAAAPVAKLTPVYDPSLDAIDVAPPSGGWTRHHTYAVALIADAAGLKGAQGEPVIGSPTWELVSSPNPLLDCPLTSTGAPNLASSDCTLAVDIIPSTRTDPSARLSDQLQSARQLEQIREGYAPILSAIEKQYGFADAANIPILWTFSIVDAGEVTFDPANGVIPFPNDVLLSKGKVALPSPGSSTPPTADVCAKSTDPTVQLYCGLNTLDGFSTVAPPLSNNSTTVDAVAQAHLDPSASVPAGAVGLVPLAATSGASAAELKALEYTPCINCLASGGAASSPQKLEWQLNAPLAEKTTYLAYVTSDLKDDQGKNVIANPIFALLRLTNPLVVGGKTQVDVLTDSQATQLEPLRQAMQPAFDALAIAGVARSKVTLAWSFTTQTEGTALDQLYAFGASSAGSPGIYIFADQTSQYVAAANAAGIPIDSVGRFYIGVFSTLLAVTGPNGTLDTGNPQIEPVAFALAVPDPTKIVQPAAGYPVTIFGHGLTRDRSDFLPLANALAKAGQVSIASDTILHGERSSCTGSSAFLSQALGMTVSDDFACSNPMTMKCNEDSLIGRCVARDDSTRIPCPGLSAPGPDMTGNLVCQARRLGNCEADGKCEGGDFLRDLDTNPTSGGHRPVISGWNIFSLSNFFATRDNFRQQVIDLSRLVHTLHVTPLETEVGGTLKFDLTRLNYVGMSLGGILGTLFNAVSPDTNNVVLNVPGGDLLRIILDAGSFQSQKASLVAGLALKGILPGTSVYDQFLGLVQWVLDPADPANLGWRLTHPDVLSSGVSAPNASRKAFIQFIENDQTVPNSSNFALVQAADRPFSATPPSFGCTSPLFCYEFTDSVDGFDATSVPLGGRHGFLLQPPAASMQSPSPQALSLTVKAQTQVATFVATGNYQ